MNLEELRLARHHLGNGIYQQAPVSGGIIGVIANVEALTGADVLAVNKDFEVLAIRPKGTYLEVVLLRRV